MEEALSVLSEGQLEPAKADQTKTKQKRGGRFGYRGPADTHIHIGFQMIEMASVAHPHKIRIQEAVKVDVG